MSFDPGQNPRPKIKLDDEREPKPTLVVHPDTPPSADDPAPAETAGAILGPPASSRHLEAWTHNEESVGAMHGIALPSANVDTEISGNTARDANPAHDRLAITKAQIQEANRSVTYYLGGIVDEIKRLKVPIAILATIAAIPKIVKLWCLAILLKPLVSLVVSRLPSDMQEKLKSKISARLKHAQWCQDLNDGLDQGRPFVLALIYLRFMEFTLPWMGWHWVKGLREEIRGTAGDAQEKIDQPLVFAQNAKGNRVESENNFVHSRAFSIVVLTVFVLGIPALCSASLYNKLGIDRFVTAGPAVRVNAPRRKPLSELPDWAYTLNYPKGPQGPAEVSYSWRTVSLEPPPWKQAEFDKANKSFLDQSHIHGPTGVDATAVAGYQGF